MLYLNMWLSFLLTFSFLLCYIDTVERLIHMSSDLAEMMFDVLSNRIGEEVICTQWFFGKPMEVAGVLESVVPFDKVKINGTVIPFVGERQAIERITMEEKLLTGGTKPKIIYSNPGAIEYDKKLGEVPLAQEEMLGYSVDRNGPYHSYKDQCSYSSDKNIVHFK